MKNKTTMKYHFTCIRMTRIRKSAARNAGEKAKKSEPNIRSWGNVKMLQPLWKTIWQPFK